MIHFFYEKESEENCREVKTDAELMSARAALAFLYH
jgi:hypothetical protein